MSDPATRASPARPRVAFQGERGAYSEQAVVALWPDGATPVPARRFADVADLVVSGVVDAGLFPFENTVAGSVGESCDALIAEDGLTAIGEVIIPIHHALLALPGATLAGLRTVESHPVALAQCRRFLDAHPALLARAAEDTAGAAIALLAAGDPTRAAIASAELAEALGLVVLANRIEDRPDNQTRFVAVAKAGTGPLHPLVGVVCTLLLVEAAGGAGSLPALLTTLEQAGLTLRGITPRPTGEPWRPHYLIDLTHDGGDAALRRALVLVEGRARTVRTLGTFAPADTDAALVSAADRREGGYALDQHRDVHDV